MFRHAKSRRRTLGKSFAGEARGRQAERIQRLLLRADLLESIVSRGDDGESVSERMTKVASDRFCERCDGMSPGRYVFGDPPGMANGK